MRQECVKIFRASICRQTSSHGQQATNHLPILLIYRIVFFTNKIQYFNYIKANLNCMASCYVYLQMCLVVSHLSYNMILSSNTIFILLSHHSLCPTITNIKKLCTQNGKNSLKQIIGAIWHRFSTTTVVVRPTAARSKKKLVILYLYLSVKFHEVSIAGWRPEAYLNFSAATLLGSVLKQWRIHFLKVSSIFLPTSLITIRCRKYWYNELSYKVTTTILNHSTPLLT